MMLMSTEFKGQHEDFVKLRIPFYIVIRFQTLKEMAKCTQRSDHPEQENRTAAIYITMNIEMCIL